MSCEKGCELEKIRKEFENDVTTNHGRLYVSTPIYKCPNSCGPNEGCSECPKSTKQSYSRLKVQGKWKSYVRKLYEDKDVKFAAETSYNPQDVAKLYGWPTGITGTVFPIYLIELGGGYNLANITNFFVNTLKLPAPKITDISVDGATNNYSSNPSDASVEVVLDVVLCAAVYSYMTGLHADVRVYFCQNTDQSFLNGVNAIAMAGNGAASCSWGSPESQNSPSQIVAMDKAFLASLNNGVTWTAAAGDALEDDGTNSPTGDYPATSPYVISCGGTTLLSNGPTTIASESVWNSGPGEGTGGGYSQVEPIPTWQKGIVQGNFRGEPDVTACADPATGYNVPVFGVIGGTSAVAPLYAGYFAAAMTKVGKPLGNVLPTLYANESTFRDIVLGNNNG